ncbi:MAG TPA: sulfatase-like hydrolase/transferase [Methyloceanibacter sp.]
MLRGCRLLGALDSATAICRIPQKEDSYRAELQALRSVDDLLGSVEEALNASGKLDNTMIIYTSDNGYVYGDHRLFGKNSVYEPSIRVPLVVRGPGIPGNETRNQLVNNLDVAATIQEVSGVKPGKSPTASPSCPFSMMPRHPGGAPSWSRVEMA